MLPSDVEDISNLIREEETNSVDTAQTVNPLLSIAQEGTSEDTFIQDFGAGNPQNQMSGEELNDEGVVNWDELA